LRRNKLGKYDPAREAQLQQEREAQALIEAELASKMKVGDRCEVAVPGQPIKRGQVMFIGVFCFS
jgi:tubulin-specific chaperone B